ncbi:MAG: HAD family hydrolase [Gemmataceae bacterium]|nr:HAD family hydrolase [Gemmataceae bacterium]
MRIAMWSGPRNLSTAMMRSFASRSDTFVTDEPFYSAFLKESMLPHPGAEEVIRNHESDWKAVLKHLNGPIPDGKKIWYQKHMAHHLLPGMDCDWVQDFRHAFLIRDPVAVVASLTGFIHYPTLRDTGLPQQAAIFHAVKRWTGKIPPVIDCKDLLADPRGMLSKLCARLEIPFEESMLSWKAGIHPTDGCWAKHWYAKVAQTTGFEAAKEKRITTPEELEPILFGCKEIFSFLYENRIVP